MTIEELEAAYRAANKLASEAQEASRVAHKAWRDAKLEATGLMGCVVERVNYRGVAYRFVVSGFGWSDSIVRGRMVKKDGTLGERFHDSEISKVKNLGPFKPEPVS